MELFADELAEGAFEVVQQAGCSTLCHALSFSALPRRQWSKRLMRTCEGGHDGARVGPPHERQHQRVQEGS